MASTPQPGKTQEGLAYEWYVVGALTALYTLSYVDRTILGLLIGFISLTTALLFFIGSVLFGTMISISAVLLEEFTTRRYAHPLDLASLIWAALVENFGYRQTNAIWRFSGIFQALRKKKKKVWGKLTRQGFSPQTT